jgi:hypothetical protein
VCPRLSTSFDHLYNIQCTTTPGSVSDARNGYIAQSSCKIPTSTHQIQTCRLTQEISPNRQVPIALRRIQYAVRLGTSMNAWDLLLFS